MGFKLFMRHLNQNYRLSNFFSQVPTPTNLASFLQNRQIMALQNMKPLNRSVKSGYNCYIFSRDISFVLNYYKNHQNYGNLKGFMKFLQMMNYQDL